MDVNPYRELSRDLFYWVVTQLPLLYRGFSLIGDIYRKRIMGPEEFHYLDKFNNEYFRNMREVRITSLYWVWDNLQSNSPSIKRKTVIELIPYTSLEKLLFELEEDERYEDCKVVFDIMQLYNENEKNTEFKQLF